MIEQSTSNEKRHGIVFWSCRIFNLLILFFMTGWESFIRWEWPVPVFFLLLYLSWEIPAWLRFRFVHRLWIRLATVPLLFACALCVSPISLSPETTFITSPRLSNNREPDYFIALKERLEPKCSPDENGARDLLAELGENGFRPYCTIPPVIIRLHNEWSEDQESEFAAEYWQILCREWQLLPDQTASCSWQNPYQAKEDPNHLFSLKSIPWNASEAPGLVLWLERNNAALNMFKSTLEKPYWFFPMIRRHEEQPIYFLPNYGQEITKSFVNGLRLRITFSLGQEKFEDALSDFRSLIHLAHHARRYASYWRYHWICAEISEVEKTILSMESLPTNCKDEVERSLLFVKENNDSTGQMADHGLSMADDIKTVPIGLNTEDRLYCDRIYNLDLRRSLLYGQWYDPWAEGEYPPYPCLQKVLIRLVWLLPWDRYFRNLNRYIDCYDEAVRRNAKEFSPELQGNTLHPVQDLFRKGMVNCLMDSLFNDMNYRAVYSTPLKMEEQPERGISSENQ